MTVLADAMNTLFDLLLAPFGEAAAWAVLTLSLGVGVLMLLIFRAATDQEALVAARRVLTGRVYEMGLYQDHLGVLARIQGDLALANLRYLRRSAPALLAMLVPMVLILAQMEARFGHRPFTPGETTLVTATLRTEGAALLDGLRLEAPAGVLVESAPVRDPGARAATWRVRIEQEGVHEVAVVLPDGRAATKILVAGRGAPRLATVRQRESLARTFLNPAEAPLPGDLPLQAIAARLPARTLVYFGVGLSWLMALCLFSVAFGLAVKDALHVRF